MCHCIINILLLFTQPSPLIILSDNGQSLDGSWSRALTASAADLGALLHEYQCRGSG